MPRKGQFKPPVLPLTESCDMAVRSIERHVEGVAIFMVGGEVKAVRKSAPSFDSTVDRLASHLVGIYNLGFDHRNLRADMETFYR
jgi:hypothetical protein